MLHKEYSNGSIKKKSRKGRSPFVYKTPRAYHGQLFHHSIYYKSLKSQSEFLSCKLPFSYGAASKRISSHKGMAGL